MFYPRKSIDADAIRSQLLDDARVLERHIVHLLLFCSVLCLISVISFFTDVAAACLYLFVSALLVVFLFFHIRRIRCEIRAIKESRYRIVTDRLVAFSSDSAHYPRYLVIMDPFDKSCVRDVFTFAESGDLILNNRLFRYTGNPDLAKKDTFRTAVCGVDYLFVVVEGREEKIVRIFNAEEFQLVDVSSDET
jgi:hypothetical protein